MSRSLCWVVLLAAVAPAAEASAARIDLLEVGCNSTYKCSGTEGLLQIDDPDGADDVLELRGQGAELVLRGTPAPTPGVNCRAAAVGEVRCVLPRGVVITQRIVSLGGGNDRLTLDGIGGADVDGDSGDDQLVVDGDIYVSWAGGPGADSASGSNEIVSRYAKRIASVSVSYDGLANDGEAAEGDNVGRVGSALGGEGDDVLVADHDGSQLRGLEGADQLTGGPGTDRLEAGAGDDVVRALGGADFLDGDTGSDLLDAGEGNDTLRAKAAIGERDVLQGGPGIDKGGIGASVLPFVVDLDAEPVDSFGPMNSYEGLERVDLGVGAGRARLLGSAAPETLTLYGGPGSLLSGGAGDDRLATGGRQPGVIIDGGPGRDQVLVDDARNILRLRDGEADRARCDEQGLTTAPQLDSRDVLEGCGAPMVVDIRRLRLRGRELVVPVACPRVTGRPCVGTVRVADPPYEGSRAVYRTRPVGVRIAAGSMRRILVRFGPRTARSLAALAGRQGGSATLGAITVRRLERQRTAVKSIDEFRVTVP